MNLHKYQLIWKGFIGGPGVSTFYFDAAATINHTAMTAFVNALKSSCPATVTWQFPGSGVTIDESTGLVVGNWSAPGPADVTAIGSGAYPAASGAVINWKTGVYAAGRELRGKTFVVPLTGAAYSGTGLVTTTTASAISAAANALAGSSPAPRVYSPTAHQSAPVATATVPTLAAVLTSRRD